MDKASKLRVLAVGVMVMVGFVAPAAAWYINEPDARAPIARDVLDEAIDLSAIERPRRPPIRIEAVEVVTPMRRALPAAATNKHCFWHDSQTLARGKVRICDIERTPNARDHDLDASPRDLPSPSGLIER